MALLGTPWVTCNHRQHLRIAVCLHAVTARNDVAKRQPRLAAVMKSTVSGREMAYKHIALH
jgi:hypothetical protein